MAAAILDQGKPNLRDALRGVAGNFISHVGLATDATAFAAGQLAVDPANGGGANLLIKAASYTVVDASTLDVLISVTGATELTNKTIFTISLCKGAARTDAITRSVRSQGIGVQDGDVFNVGARVKVEDNS